VAGWSALNPGSASAAARPIPDFAEFGPPEPPNPVALSRLRIRPTGGQNVCGSRIAPTSAVVPFNYFSLAWATILGFLVWGDMPSAALLVDSAIGAKRLVGFC